jgi:protease secretion system outer membrane protein
VQVNIPLYAGGSVAAATTQAVANHEKAKADLEAKTRQVLVELRKQYDQVLSSAAKIDAMVKSVNSARALVQATQQSVKGGVRINLDVLNAQQQVYAAQRDLAQARYNYVISYLRLRFAAGTLTTEDLHTVAKYFVGGGSDVVAQVSALLVKAAPRAAVPLAPVAPAAPSGKAAASGPQADNAAHVEVLAVVEQWAKAWSARDVQAYLGHYASDFKPGQGLSRDAWAKQRQARIQEKANIAVGVESPEVRVGGDTATVRFKQIYRSDRLSEEGRKTLSLVRQGGAWKIRQESAAR